MMKIKDFRFCTLLRPGRAHSFTALLLGVLLASSASHARAAAPATNYPVVVFDAVIAAGVPEVGAKVIVEPLQDRITNGAGQVFLPRQINMTTGTNGAVETNLYVPGAYRVRWITQSPKSELAYTNVFPEGLTGRVFSADYIFPNTNSAPGAIAAYSMVQSDGRFPQIAGTNLIAVTNVVGGQTVITWHGTGGGGVGEVTTDQLNAVSNLLTRTKAANTNAQLYGHHTMHGTNGVAPWLEFDGAESGIGLLRWDFGGSGAWDIIGAPASMSISGAGFFVMQAYSDHVDLGDTFMTRVESIAPLVAPSLALDDVANVGGAITALQTAAAGLTNGKLDRVDGHAQGLVTDSLRVTTSLNFDYAQMTWGQSESGVLKLESALDAPGTELVRIDGNSRGVTINEGYDFEVAGTFTLTGPGSNAAPVSYLGRLEDGTVVETVDPIALHGPQIAGNSNQITSVSNLITQAYSNAVWSASNALAAADALRVLTLNGAATNLTVVSNLTLGSGNGSFILTNNPAATNFNLRPVDQPFGRGLSMANNGAVTISPTIGTTNVSAITGTNAAMGMFVAPNGIVNVTTNFEAQNIRFTNSGKSFAFNAVSVNTLSFTRLDGSPAGYMTASYQLLGGVGGDVSIWDGSTIASQGNRIASFGGASTVSSWKLGLAHGYRISPMAGDANSGTEFPGEYFNTNGIAFAGLTHFTNGIQLIATSVSPGAPAVMGAIYWTDGTNTCETIRNSAGTITTNKLSKTAWP